MEKKVRVVLKQPQQNPKELYVLDKLETFQGLLEGYMEAIMFFGRVWILCNEEGKLLNLKPNIDLGNDVLVGNIIFVASDSEGDFVDLSDEEIEKIYEFLD